MEAFGKNYGLEDMKSLQATISSPEPLRLNNSRSSKFIDGVEIWAEKPVHQQPNVYIKVSKCDESFIFPTVESLIEATPHMKAFGEMNEIEFSCNAMFKEPIIATESRILHDDRIVNGVVLKRRQYLSSYIDVFFNKHSFSTKYFEGSRHESVNVVTRVDSLGLKDPKITSKLRVVRMKFNSRGAEFVVSGSIEVALDIMTPMLDVQCGTTKLLIYWSVVLTCDEMNYRFRIAFRKKINSNSPYFECNIECEDQKIDGHSFAQCFYILYNYYKHQYESRNRHINPIYQECDFEKLSGLNEKQKQIAATITHVPDCAADENPAAVELKMQQFVKFLGLASYINFINDKSAYCLESFDQLTIEKYKENNINHKNEVETETDNAMLF